MNTITFPSPYLRASTHTSKTIYTTFSRPMVDETMNDLMKVLAFA